MKLSRKYFSLAMATLMLMMSIGVTVHKMVCLASGTVTLSFLENEDCCTNEETENNSLATKCCDYTTDYFKLDFQTLVSSFTFKFDFVADYSLVPVFTIPEFLTQKFSEANHSPPQLSGKSILLLVSIFRV